MNVTWSGRNSRVNSTQLWFAAGAAVVLGLVGFVANWWLNAYWPEPMLITGVVVAVWICSIAAVALVVAAIGLAISDAIRRLMR